MPLDEIRKSIDKEAKARADSITEEGESEAEAVVKEAKARAAEILKAAKADAVKEAGRVKIEQLSGAQIEINSMFVNAREAVLERHAGQIQRSIESQLSGKNLSKLVEGAARQFTKFGSKSDMVVRAGKRNTQIVKKLGYEVVAGKEDDLSIEAKDGSISIDVSPSGLAERHAADARSILASKLWKVKG